MANKSFDGKVFEDYDALREILPAQNGGVVIVEEKAGLMVRGAVMTAKDGNYKRALELAESGAKNMNPGKTVEVIMV